MYKQVLEDIGFFDYQDKLDAMYSRGVDYLEGFIKQTETSPFHLIKQSSGQIISNVLVIDIGGTNNRAAFYDQEGICKPLFSLFNEDLLPEKLSDYPLNDFFQFIIDICSKELVEVQRIAVIWSNNLEHYEIPGKGIGGKVSGREKHNKNEWFLEKVADRDDIAEIFLKKLRDNNYNPEAFVIMNDTTATFFAEPDAYGAMIVSTGINASYFYEGDIYNPELGNNLARSLCERCRWARHR